MNFDKFSNRKITLKTICFVFSGVLLYMEYRIKPMIHLHFEFSFHPTATEMFLVIILCLLLGISTLTSSTQGITITSRTQWEARSPKAETKISAKDLPVPFVVVHHCMGSNSTSCMGIQCAAIVRRYQAFHMDKKGRKDISYNFMVAPTGEIFEGRGWGIKGSHSVPYNSKSMGICFIGNYTNEMPSEKAFQSVNELIEFGVNSQHIQSNYTLIGHRQSMPTSCPGNKLFDIIKTWSHWRNV